MKTKTQQTMTNAEINLTEAIKNMNDGKLNDYESSFISDIKDYDKKQLKGLSSKQYKFMRTCADK